MANTKSNNRSDTRTDTGSKSDDPNLRHPTGPTSTEGIVASDLPDGGRGNVDTDPGHEMKRHVPQHTGEVVGSDINNDIGLTGNPEMRRADQENTLGRHQGDK